MNKKKKNNIVALQQVNVHMHMNLEERRQRNANESNDPVLSDVMEDVGLPEGGSADNRGR